MFHVSFSCNAEFVSFEHSSFSCLMSVSHVMVPTEHSSVFCWYVCGIFTWQSWLFLMLSSESWLQSWVWILWVFVQNFLSELNPSLEIPPSKLTRWHPRFALDSVPDIEPSELPAPPVKVYQTAVQVLGAAGEKLPARVRRTISVRRRL